MRRAVVRAASSATRVPSSKTSMLGVATKIAPKFAIPTTTVRCFSQTLRVANEDAFSEMQRESNGGGEQSQSLAAQPILHLCFVGSKRAVNKAAWC